MYIIDIMTFFFVYISFTWEGVVRYTVAHKKKDFMSLEHAKKKNNLQNSENWERVRCNESLVCFIYLFACWRLLMSQNHQI